MKPARARATLLSLALLAGGFLDCTSSRREPGPPDCTSCHPLAQLCAEVSRLPPREWTAEAGRGLTRRPSLVVDGMQRFDFVFPRRGHHPAGAAGACGACHPVSAQGIRHGISEYPKEARGLALAGGQSCAPACHQWLYQPVTSVGFAPAQGSPPRFEGSLDPHHLLTAVSSGHSRLYRQGYNAAPSSGAGGGGEIAIRRIQPGCAGCHNTQSDKHGRVTECLDCHVFGGLDGAMHQEHVTTIDGKRAQVDPGHAGEPSCNYCHGFNDPPTALRNAACYGCHLSGHQPVAASGQPHFW